VKESSIWEVVNMAVTDSRSVGVTPKEFEGVREVNPADRSLLELMFRI